MDAENQVAPSAAPTRENFEKRAPRELIIIYNPPSNTNRVFVAVNGDASTTDTDQPGLVVSPGTPFPFPLDERNDGLSVIAENADTAVVVFRQSFRTEAEWAAATVALATVSLYANLFFRQTGGDTLIPLIPITTLQAALGLPLIFESDQAEQALLIGDGVAGGIVMGAAPEIANQLVLAPPNVLVGNRLVVRDNNQEHVFRSNAGARVLFSNALHRFNSSAAVEVRVNAGGPLTVMAGNDVMERHRFDILSRHLRAVSDGEVDTVFDSMEFPVADGQTINPLDLVILDLGGNRVRAAAAGAARVMGFAEGGATGNADGSIKVSVRFAGVVTTFLADNAGVTEGEYAIAGATDVNQIASQVAAAGSFGLILKSGATTDPTVILLSGAR